MIYNFIEKICFRILLGIILSCLIIQIAIEKMPQKFLGDQLDYYTWKFQIENATKFKKERINIIIGDSKGLSCINPKLLDGNYYNYSLTGASIIDGYLTLKKSILKQHIDTILMCYSPMHFEMAETFYNRTISFQTMTNSELFNLFKLEKKYGVNIDIKEKKDLSITRKLELFSRLNKFGLSYRKEFINNLLNNNSKKEKSIEIMSKNKGYLYWNNTKLRDSISYEGRVSKFSENVIIECYLDSIIEIAQKNKIKIFIITPPINKSTYKNGKNNYLKEFNNYINKISISKNTPRINNIIVLKNSFFADNSHLNQIGGLMFTNLINQILYNKKATRGGLRGND